jgi:Peptide N-acetyl-beta-D-glucosaminyl asparaginase amidase A
MNPTTSPIRRRLMTLTCVLPILAIAAMAQSTNRQIGTQFEATADPLVPRPHSTPCVVPLFSAYQFASFSESVQTFPFSPPAACPGRWSKVVLEINFSENGGVQFDRTTSLFLGNTNIYFGTTPEPLPSATNTWHVERDVTDYTALLTIPQAGTIVLANCTTDCPAPYNTFLNGIFTVNADLEFYPASGDDQGNEAPDEVLPLTQSNGSGGFDLPAILSSPSQLLSTTFTLPTNIERAYLDVVPQSQSGDEFWYTCVPNDVASELFSCANTGFRETEVAVDGQPAGVAPVSPWIYTGGIDPFLWFPSPGVQTLDFIPYRVDLTPFAGVLSDGNPHTVAFSVFNDNGYFSVTGSLVLFLDHGSAHVTGAVTKNTLAAAPSPVVTENLTTGSTITGTVDVSSDRSYTLSGYVNTSHGKVSTSVSQHIRFANNQSFNITSTLYVQDINLTTDVFSVTRVSNAGDSITYTRNFHFPAVVDISQITLSNGNISATTTTKQSYQVQSGGQGGDAGFVSLVNNTDQAQDTLLFGPNFGSLLGNSNQSASQHYVSANSNGGAYDCRIAVKNNTLTKVSGGCKGGQD